MLDSLFRFLFKYPPLIFQQGDFAWGLSRPVLLVVRRRGARRPGAAHLSRRLGRRSARAIASVLVGLRLAAAGGPALLPVPAGADPEGGGAAAELPRRPGRRLAQHDDRRPRRPAAQRVRPASSSAARTRRCSNALSQRFVLRFFRFSSSADRLPAAGDLKYDGTATRLGAGARARARRAGRPAARRPGDGHRRRRHLGRRARRVARQPEGAVDSGVHRRRRPGAVRARHPGHARRNAARGRSRAPRSSSTSCCRRPATPAQTVPLNVEDDGRIVSTQDVTLPADGESATVRVRFTAADAGRAAVPLQGRRRRPASRSRRTTRATR